MRVCAGSGLLPCAAARGDGLEWRLPQALEVAVDALFLIVNRRGRMPRFLPRPEKGRAQGTGDLCHTDSHIPLGFPSLPLEATGFTHLDRSKCASGI